MEIGSSVQRIDKMRHGIDYVANSLRVPEIGEAGLRTPRRPEALGKSVTATLRLNRAAQLHQIDRDWQWKWQIIIR
ncbi:hypothetical protein ATE71_09795 [Sphingopyxis sp. H115]|nr:hypothetical protein ATE71_09795 [Sphingopyxis sp. H115]